MKKITIAATIVAALTIGTIVVIAQISHKGGFGNHFGAANHHEKIIVHLSDKLKLNDAQKTQAKQVLADSKPRFEPLLKQLKESHHATMNLGSDGVFDEQKAREAATRQAEIIKQILVEKEKTKAALFAVLTNEQREQAKQLLSDFVENFDH